MIRSTLWFVYIIIPLLYSSSVLPHPPTPPPYFLEDAPGALPDYSHCVRLPVCDPDAKYRTSDGTCNNLQNPLWGSSFTPFARLLPAVYSDGLREMRKAKNGGYLPSARRIHTEIFVDADRPSFYHTTALMEWGQVMTHDIAGKIERPATGCCTSDNRIPAVIPDACIPIAVPKNDPYLSHFNVTCSPMGKSVTSTERGCELKPDQQISDATHYMDASLTYGSTQQMARTLREFRSGLLRVQTNGKGEEFPPNAQNTTGICLNLTEKYNTCYLGGDPLRINQQMNIAAVQIVLLREHNRLARRLAKLNPKWDDERLYQEARRILIAQFQHISYSEYLPHIIVPILMIKNDLYSLPVGLRFDYNASIHVNVLNEFTTAVFRVFHSNVPSNIDFQPESRACPYASFKMNDWAFNPSLLQEHLDGVVRSMVTQPQQELDRFITVELSERFARPNPFFGFDLVSIDILRGRHHGLPPYNALREVCGLPKARTFHDLHPNFSYKNIKFLQRLYKHPDDIDAFVGCMLEEKFFDLAGFTSQCIMAEQFRRLKFGDRNFYEFGGQPGSFTQKQIEAIREGSLFSALLCRNTNIQFIQWNGFNTIFSENPLVSCKLLPKLDLLPWKE